MLLKNSTAPCRTGMGFCSPVVLQEAKNKINELKRNALKAPVRRDVLGNKYFIYDDRPLFVLDGKLE